MRGFRAIRAAVCGLAVLAIAGSAAADDDDNDFVGVYLSLDAVGAYEFVEDGENEFNNLTLLRPDDQGDWVAGGGMGFGYDWYHQFGVSLRTELEFIHIVRTDVDSRPVFTNAFPSLGYENNLSNTTIMFNTEYDFRLGTWFWPYVGFGIGYANNHSEVYWHDIVEGRRIQIDSDDDSFAYSVQTGMIFKITDRWWSDVGYRFTDLGSALLETNSETTDGGATLLYSAQRIRYDTIHRHDLRIGFGVKF